jgi:hypothetical protein
MPHLIRRDDTYDEYLLPKPVIVLLVMLGAEILVVVGYAIYSTFGFGKNDLHGIRTPSEQQKRYMREVRERNLNALMYEARRIQVNGRMMRGETVY